MGLQPPATLNLRPDRSPRRSLRTSLQGWLMGVALIPLAIAGTVGYTSARRAQFEDIDRVLTTTAATGKEAVHDHFARAMRELDDQSRLQSNRDFLAALKRDLAATDLPPRAWIRSESWERLVADSGHELSRFRTGSPWYDVMLIDATGVVLFSCRRQDDLGSNILTGPYGRSMLAEAAQEALQTGGMVLSPFGPYGPAGGLGSAFAVVPMVGDGSEPSGLLAFQLDTGTLDAALHRGAVPGDVARLYLVDDDLRLLTAAGDGASIRPLRDRVLTEAATGWLERERQALNGMFAAAGGEASPQPGVRNTYRGVTDVPVFGHSATIDALDRRFGLIVEIDAADALAGLHRIRMALLIIFACTAVVAALAGQLVSRRVVQPILALGHLMNRVADGHEVTDLNVVGHNEVGDLADRFATMIDHLDEAKRIRDHQFRLQRSQAELNERMRGEPDTETLAAAILEHIGEHYAAQAGAFYLARPGQSLALVAHFGAADDDWPVRRLREGQGVVGRAAMRRRIQVLHDVPPDHMAVQTALGRSRPRSLIVAPFHLAGQIKGVMELATHASVDDADLEFLRLTAESIAVALDSSRSRERVNRLLEETRRQAGTLSRQQKELQDKNERLARSDRYKSEFLANMSHELRTPLNSMMLMAQVLSENRGGRLDGSEIEAAQTIHQAGQELLTIIDDILDLSKVEAGKLELNPEDVAIADVLDELRQLFEPVAAGKGLEFRAYRGPDVPDHLHTDEVRLKQILKNLLSNACKFTERGSVVLRARTPSRSEIASLGCPSLGECVAFSVSDTGIGMSREVAGQVFEAFNQGDGSIGRRFGGSGLGLSISRSLTAMLEGHLELASVESKGTKFTLYLPLRPILAPAVVGPSPSDGDPVPSTTEPASGAARAPDLGFLDGRAVLLADNEMRTVYQLTDELERAGLTPEVQRRLPDLVDRLEALSGPAVVLLNPWLGSAESGTARGDDLIGELRRLVDGADVRFVALVPPSRESDIGQADAVVTKPLRLDALVAGCRRALDRREVRV